MAGGVGKGEGSGGRGGKRELGLVCKFRKDLKNVKKYTNSKWIKARKKRQISKTNRLPL